LEERPGGADYRNQTIRTGNRPGNLEKRNRRKQSTYTDRRVRTARNVWFGGEKRKKRRQKPMRTVSEKKQAQKKNAGQPRVDRRKVQGSPVDRSLRDREKPLRLTVGVPNSNIPAIRRHRSERKKGLCPRKRRNCKRIQTILVPTET